METEFFIHKENLTLICFNTIDEVPSAHTLDDKKAYNRISGVYQSEHRKNTFYLVHKRSDIQATRDSLTKLALPQKPILLQFVIEIDIATLQEHLFSYYAELTFDLMSMPPYCISTKAYTIVVFIKKNYIIAEDKKNRKKKDWEEEES